MPGCATFCCHCSRAAVIIIVAVAFGSILQLFVHTIAKIVFCISAKMVYSANIIANEPAHCRSTTYHRLVVRLVLSVSHKLSAKWKNYLFENNKRMEKRTKWEWTKKKQRRKMYDAVNYNGCCYTTALRHTPHSCQPELHTYLSVSSFVASSEMCAVDARASHIVGTRIIIITRRWKQFSNAVRVRTRLLASFTLLPSHRSLAHVVMLTHTAYMCVVFYQSILRILCRFRFSHFVANSQNELPCVRGRSRRTLSHRSIWSTNHLRVESIWGVRKRRVSCVKRMPHWNVHVWNFPSCSAFGSMVVCRNDRTGWLLSLLLSWTKRVASPIPYNMINEALRRVTCFVGFRAIWTRVA